MQFGPGPRMKWLEMDEGSLLNISNVESIIRCAESELRFCVSGANVSVSFLDSSTRDAYFKAIRSFLSNDKAILKLY